MADSLTTILRRAGEVPDPALLDCELAQAFVRVILCLRSLQREEAQVLVISTSDPAQAAMLNTASERWAELCARLEFIGELPFTPGHPNRMLIHAVWLMRTGLCARDGRGNHVRVHQLLAKDIQLMLQGEGRLGRQTALLVREALDLFKAIPGHDCPTSYHWNTRQTHQQARHPLGSAGGKAHLRAAVAKALVRPARKMSARFLGSPAYFRSAA